MVKYTTTLKNPFYFITNEVLFNINEKQDNDECGQHLVTYKQSLDKDGNPIYKTARSGTYYLDEHHNKILNDSGSDISYVVYGDVVDNEKCKDIFPSFDVVYYQNTGTINYETITYYIQDLIADGDKFIDGKFVRNDIHNNNDSEEEDIYNNFPHYHWNGSEYELMTIVEKEEIPQEQEETYISVEEDIYQWQNGSYVLIDNFAEKTELPLQEEEEFIVVIEDVLYPDMQPEEEIKKDTTYSEEFVNSVIEDIKKAVKSGSSFEKITNSIPHWLLQSNYGKEFTVNGKKMVLFNVNGVKQLTDEDLWDIILETINDLVVEFTNKKLSVLRKRMKTNDGDKVIMVESNLVEDIL